MKRTGSHSQPQQQSNYHCYVQQRIRSGTSDPPGARRGCHRLSTPVSSRVLYPLNTAQPTYDGSGKANFSTRSTGFSQPSLIMSSIRLLARASICGLIVSACARVNIGATMLLCSQNVLERVVKADSTGKASPLLHMLGRIHIDKRRSILGRSLTASVHLREPRTGTLLRQAVISENAADILVLDDEPRVASIPQCDS